MFDCRVKFLDNIMMVYNYQVYAFSARNRGWASTM